VGSSVDFWFNSLFHVDKFIEDIGVSDGLTLAYLSTELTEVEKLDCWDVKILVGMTEAP
jgi:hypothetical protein